MTAREEGLVDAAARLACAAFVWHDENGERRIDIPVGMFEALEAALAPYEQGEIGEGLEVAA